VSNSVNTSVNPVVNEPAISPSPRVKSPAVEQPARRRILATEQSVSTQNAAPLPQASEPTVTFRRDANGQIYYVITDSETGKELGQLPPEAVRKVGEGIAEFLKHEQEKQSTHLRVKA
jgi:hypothetical protein